MKSQPKNFLFELNHPAQGHLFKNAIRELMQKGYPVTVYAKKIPVLFRILDAHGIPYRNMGSKGTWLMGKGLHQIKNIAAMSSSLKKGHLNVGVGVSVALPVLSRISSLHSIVLDDDDKAATPLFASIAHRFCDVLFRPAALSFEGKSPSSVYYNGYHELAYLHPSLFHPDRDWVENQGISTRKPFFLIRQVALKAHHDKRIRGISQEVFEKIVTILRPHGRIFLTREDGAFLPPGVEILKTDPAMVHHIMAFARLVISDGQTMCSEASCLGVPSVRINDFAGRISSLEEQEKRWNLSFGFRPEDAEAAFSKIRELVQIPVEEFHSARDLMLSYSIPFTNFIIWFLEGYPESRLCIHSHKFTNEWIQ